MKKSLLILATTLLFASCTDAKRDRSRSVEVSPKFRVELLGVDGETCKEWISKGKVLSEETSDNYYFVNSKTGNLVKVTGTLIVTRLN